MSSARESPPLADVLREFVDLSPEVERAIDAAFVPRELPVHGRLVGAGEICTRIAFVERGLLIAYSVESGRDVSCDVFSEGDFATDYVSFLGQTPSTVDLVALEPCSLLTVSREALDRLYDEFPAVDRLGRRIAEAQYIGVVRRASALLTQTPAERYQAFARQRPDLLDRLPQYLLAKWLGITPESLSRIRRRIVTTQRIATGTSRRVPSKSKAPSTKSGGPKVPRASREKP
ncbi:MAG: Crp/Fnr family transcriptional regulator [Deltaproteobacteria bacterium]|nr:Crp/Fnr family transcriptional regulator [Deltaproteobacteria bacterium]